MSNSSLSNEECILLALCAIQLSGVKPDGDPCLSLRQAAADYGVSRTTLTARFHGRKTRKEAHEKELKVTKEEEDVLVAFTKVMGRRGNPLNPCLITEYASKLAGVPLGESWVQRFRARHPDLKVRWTTGLEQCRAQALSPTLV